MLAEAQSSNLVYFLRQPEALAAEQRSATRIALSIRIYYRPLSMDDRELVLTDLRRAQLVDISAHGAFMFGPAYLALGARLELYIPLPDGGPLLIARGRVVRHDLEREGGYGVRFLPLYAEDEARLRAMCT
jgi:hypothetical protein